VQRISFALLGGFLSLSLLVDQIPAQTTPPTKPQQPQTAPAAVDGGREPGLLKNSSSRVEPRISAPVAVKIRNLGRDKHGDLVLESDHFRISYKEKPDFMEKVVRAAERVRLEEHRKWFGEPTDEWDGKCGVYLYATHAQYAKKTKQKGAQAHFRPWMENGVVVQRGLHLPCDTPALFEDVLPHEVTHSVIATGLGGQAPRWADEGMAMLAESRASLAKWHAILRVAQDKEDLFDLEVLVRTQEEAHIRTVEYYAQSMSLVEFFVAQKGRPTFVRFLRDGVKTSFEAALKKHYSIANFAELNQRWSTYAFSKSGVAPTPSEPNLQPRSPGATRTAERNGTSNPGQ
jgi:hypothetical protein